MHSRFWWEKPEGVIWKDNVGKTWRHDTEG